MNKIATNPDILASRYASKAMRYCWSDEHKILMERDFWIAVMRSQKELGIDIPEEAITSYENVRNDINLERIAERERKLRHDVKSRIEEFCELAGYQHIHKGLTSRDLTDNVEQMQIINSLRLIRLKCVACLTRLAERSKDTRDLILVARTHNVPAQLTSVGKRLSMFGDEIILALERLDQFIATYPFRGLQGAIGTNLDQSILFQGNPEKLKIFGEKVARHLGASRVMNALGQVYPRSLDMQTIQLLFLISSGISNFAKTLRLMSGSGLASEGFSETQVGSSAMPHKQNARTSERIGGFHQVLRGFKTMIEGLSGDQWNEGDVSCSVVRRIALPGAFYTLDGQMESWLNILDEMKFNPEALNKEVEQNLPFVTSTVLLIEAIQKGGGREDAHKAISRHTLQLRESTPQGIRLADELAKNLGNDVFFPLNEKEIQNLLNHPEYWLGNGPDQIDNFLKSAENWLQRFPKAETLIPEPLL